jgi:hypothetical protein
MSSRELLRRELVGWIETDLGAEPGELKSAAALFDGAYDAFFGKGPPTAPIPLRAEEALLAPVSPGTKVTPHVFGFMAPREVMTEDACLVNGLIRELDEIGDVEQLLIRLHEAREKVLALA